MAKDKFSRLSERMYGRSSQKENDDEKQAKQRKRYTIYVDRELIDDLNQAHKKVNHDFFPAEVQKSLFLETLIQFGLDNIHEVKERLDSLENQEVESTE
ncbi:MAG: hypothetical protein KDE50_00825 [Caldilineaceae bacterium]|nr:hypothetical protein [Caldilineaceae bacterium]MCB0138429.1 hypothetical protein [Caldilineaceae bacterium]